MSAQINDWGDIHFAYQVARHGTLSAAAVALGVHHSTVLRRIDALEKRLNTRLFHRHARGYAVTEAGQLLFKAAAQTQEDFDRLLGQLEGADEQLTGTLIITSVAGSTDRLLPIIAEFQRDNPEMRVDYVADARIFKLEHGEAHISIRPGAEPRDPDYVVQHLRDLEGALFAAPSYIKQYGHMKNLKDFREHRFLASTRSMLNVPAMRWLAEQVPAQQIYFRASDMAFLYKAAVQGMGIAPLTRWMVPESKALRCLFTPPEDWATPLWLVTHRDVHRTAKVQAFTQFLKDKLLGVQT